MLVKLGSTETPAYLERHYFLAGASGLVLLKISRDLLEELEEGALGEDDACVIPVKHAWKQKAG